MTLTRKRTLSSATRINTFPVVGIGASAGGFVAFTELLGSLPVDTGMAFVLVQHLDPDHQSSLAQLLSRNTAMPVIEVTKRTRVQPNHVYVIPPDRLLTFSRGALTVIARPPTRTRPHSIDLLFESLAQDQKEKAIGIILSGTATDGTLGLEAIKAEGGITFAQDATAKYDSMPRSATAAGCVDFVLSPKAIASELARVAKHPYVRGRLAGGDEERALSVTIAKTKAVTNGEPLLAGIPKVLDLLKDRFGVDFSSYKPSTIERRITRRMVLVRSETIPAYVGLLRTLEKELDALFSDLLIGVTSFFRNAEAFEALKEKVFPKIVVAQRVDPVRVWVPGCSSGQEVYSIAMALAEYAEHTTGRIPTLQIFGTDLNEAMLSKARHGLYPKSLAGDLPPDRLRRFFVEEDGGYRITKMLRDACVFARHNLIMDPPFSRMDLISCRNLLIYLNTDLQKRILPIFHYALKPEGQLFLGASESIGTFADLFEPLDKKQKIYQKKASPTRIVAPSFPVRSTVVPRKPDALRSDGGRLGGLPRELNAQREADRVAMNQYAPPSVLIDGNLRIIQFRGATGSYLEPSTGKADFQVLKMARDGLMLPLRTAINQARKNGQPVRRKNVPLSRHGEICEVTIVVTPLKNLSERCYLISFEESGHHPSSLAVAKEPSAEPGENPRTKSGKILSVRGRSAQRVGALERELSETRDYLQSLQEQYDASTEELQVSGEELQSGNEELQSINEELETSKEELESTNEELITVNDEMVHRNTELTRLNSDLSNLHVSISTAIVVVGRDLTLWRFTPSAEKLFNLLPSDLGRLIGGIRHNLDFPALERFISEVIDSGTVREREIQDKTGRWYLLRIRPYLTLDNTIAGAVLVLVDIDALKQSERTTARALAYAEAVLRSARDPLLILREDLRVNTANHAFYQLFKTSREETDGRFIHELGNHRWDVPALRALLLGILPKRTVFDDYEITVEVPGAGARTLLLSGRSIIGSGGEPLKLILLSFQDITERVESRAALRASETRYRRLFEAAQDGILILNSATGKISDVNPYMTKFLGYPRKEFLGKELYQIGLLKDAEASQAAFAELQSKGYIRYDCLPLKTKSGECRDVEFVSNRYSEDGIDVIQCNIRDITDRQIAEETKSFLSSIVQSSAEAIVSTDLQGKITSWNRAAERLYGYSAAEAIGQSSSALLFPEDAPEEEKQLLTISQSGTAAPFDIERRQKGGTTVQVSVKLSSIQDPNGRVLGMSTMSHDITQRLKTEAALRESEERIRHLVEDVKDHAIFSLDAIGHVLSWNEAAVRMIGYEQHEMIGQHFSRLFRPADIQRGVPEQELAEAAGSGRADEDKWMMRKDGTHFWASGVCSAQRDEAGELKGFVKVVRDETERKKIADALRVSEEKFRSMVASSPDCIEELDMQGRLVSINDAGRHLLELTDLAFRLHASWLDFWQGSDHLAAQQAIEKARAGGVGLFEGFSPTATGKGKWWNVVVTPLLDSAGHPARLMVVSRDVTERKHAEQSLAEQADKLETEVNQRTQELRGTIAELEAFSYSISHDMRAPLRAMRGFSDVLLEENRDQLNPQGVQYVRKIAAAAHRMDQLIEDVLNYTRVLRSEVKLHPVDLDNLVREIIDTYPQLQDSNVELTISGNLPPVIGNEASLVQCLANLLTNAVKFIVPGTRAQVTISAEEIGEEVRLSIQDNGIGIDPKDHARIFRIYERVHSQENYGGTGIGLAIVRKAVERMQGSVGVISQPGQGSRFWIQLPKA